MSLKLVDEWQDLNLSALDATMGQKWMQKELRRRFGINGGYTNLDLRLKTSNGSSPHLQADFTKMPFKDSSFKIILFDPPFLIDSRPIPKNDYRGYRGSRRLEADFGAPTSLAHFMTRRYGAWKSRAALRKQLFQSFTEIKRVLREDGICIFKWTDSNASLKCALSLKNGLKTERVWKRRSGGGNNSTTYFCWLRK